MAAGCRDRSVGVADDGGGPDADRRFDAGVPDAEVPPHCPLDVSETAHAEGKTPLGDFVGHHGWFGVAGGECGGVHIVIVERRQEFVDALPDPFRDLEQVLGLFVEREGTGTFEAWTTFRRAGQEVTARGSVTITSYPDFNPYRPTGNPRVRGTFSVDEDGWGLEGEFDMPFCEYLMILCP